MMYMCSKSYSVSLLGRRLWILTFTDGSCLFFILMPNIIWFRTFSSLPFKGLMNPYPFAEKGNIFSSSTYITYNCWQSWDYCQKLGIVVTSHGKRTSYYSDTWTPMSTWGSSPTHLGNSPAFSPVNLGLRKIPSSTFFSKGDFTWESWLFFLFSRYQEDNSGL